MSGAPKIAGVLGGMGPDATVDFMARVIALTPAGKDQDHVHMIVDQNPAVPNRQAAILDNGEDPGPALAAMARRLAQAGADFLVIPCNTAYVFSDAVANATNVPLVSIIDVTVAAVLEHDPAAVGVLATSGCLKAGVYQDALRAAGLEPVLPDEKELGELMNLIKRIKGGDKGDEVGGKMRELALALQDRGAMALIAGCTEIPLVLDDAATDVPLIASTDVLAQETVRIARGDKPLPNQE